MTELNTHEFPPGGGWVFRQPQTAWTNPHAMVGFKASVDAIRNHRQTQLGHGPRCCGTGVAGLHPQAPWYFTSPNKFFQSEQQPVALPRRRGCCGH